MFIRGIVTKLLRDSGTYGPPVNLNKIIKYLKKERGIEFHFNEEKLPAHLLGIAHKRFNTFNICYDTKEDVTVQRNTVAHELGHLMLGHYYYTQDYTKDLNYNIRTTCEEEADLFADELLIPHNWIVKDIKKEIASMESLALKYQVDLYDMNHRIVSSDDILF